MIITLTTLSVDICLNNIAIAEEVPSRYDYDYLRYYLAVPGNQCRNQIQLQPNTKPIIYKYIMHMNSRPIHSNSTQELNISATQIILHTPLTDRKRLAEWRPSESYYAKNLQHHQASKDLPSKQPLGRGVLGEIVRLEALVELCEFLGVDELSESYNEDSAFMCSC